MSASEKSRVCSTSGKGVAYDVGHRNGLAMGKGVGRKEGREFGKKLVRRILGSLLAGSGENVPRVDVQTALAELEGILS